METYTCVIALVCAVLLLQGKTVNSQAANCYSTPFFGCRGDSTPASSVSECCELGFLSGHQAGVDTCILCVDNVICMNDTQCSHAGTFNLGPSTPEECCTNQVGGLAYVTSESRCEVCAPRTPDPTTPPPTTTLPPTTTQTTTTTTQTTTTDEDLDVPDNIGVDTAGNVGPIVGGVIGGLALVGVITTVTIVAIIVVLVAKK